jgi:hypothetical protein
MQGENIREREKSPNDLLNMCEKDKNVYWMNVVSPDNFTLIKK